MWVVTGPITVFSKDLNSYEKFTLNNPMGKTWYHAICTTKILKFKGKSKSMLYALWNLISEVQLEENWAKVNEISKLVIFNDENSEYGKTFDKPAEDGSDCYIQATFSEYFRAVAKQPQSYDLQDCLNAEFAAVAVDWPHAFPCYTKDQMEIKKKKIADSKKQIRSIYN